MRASIPIVLTMLTFISSANAAVWINRSKWTVKEQQAYSRWVKGYWSKNFFNERNLPGIIGPPLNSFYRLRGPSELARQCPSEIIWNANVDAAN